MNIRLLFQRQLRRYNLPTLSLLAFLQRTPVVPAAIATEEFVMTSPIGAILKSFVAAASAFGAMNSLAGATPLSASTGSATGISIPAGTKLAPDIAFTVSPTQTAIMSWDVKGQIPPGMNYSGATAPAVVNVQSLALSGTPTTPGIYAATFQVFQFKDKAGYSSAVFTYTVTVTAAADAAPTITTQPQSQTVTAGDAVTLSVVAAGSPAPTYQWKKDGTTLASATGASLALTSVQASNAGTYTVVVTNSAGTVTSTGAVLTVNAAPGTIVTPTVTVAPRGQTVATGSTVVFDVTGAGGGLGYQWNKGGVAILGATSRLLVLSNAQASDAGNYTVTLTNTAGAVTSSAAALAVTSTADAGRIINISTRAQVGTGANVLIAGFVVGGQGTTGSAPLLIRGSGPALVPFGVTGTLPDPQLQLYAGTSQVAMNNGWEGNTQVASTASSVGAFAWGSTTSRDSALVLSPNPGSYTAQISGAAGDTGVSLVEVYDATPAGTYTPSTPRIVNISARVQVGTGSNILIAGFVIGGSTSRTILIRASGPALVPFGVTGTLPDPQLQLYAGTTLLSSNAGWGGKPEIVSSAASVGAFAWTNSSSNDSALLVTLSPGSYTAQVSGLSNDTGVALVELYEVP